MEKGRGTLRLLFGSVRSRMPAQVGEWRTAAHESLRALKQSPVVIRAGRAMVGG